MFGRKRQEPSPDPGPGMLDDGRHWAYLMTQDGQRTSTKEPCNCPIGAEHDGRTAD
jgi:hypothetical protein